MADALAIGSRLPDLYFNRVLDPLHAKISQRGCDTCGYIWPTCEIALTTNWTGAAADCCPAHTDVPGHLISQISVDRARTGHYWAAGLMRVVGWGGYYRRRECKVCACQHTRSQHTHDGGQVKCDAPEGCDCLNYKQGCFARDGRKPMRWTTGEFSSNGVVVADVALCPRCGGGSKRMRRAA